MACAEFRFNHSLIAWANCWLVGSQKDWTRRMGMSVPEKEVLPRFQADGRHPGKRPRRKATVTPHRNRNLKLCRY